ncbi:FecR family protein [Sphingomonas sp. DT-204]|uniref:FecR family protein n=1 Tax=Sphingomonas sp. DT-204 TaxID=3396166 RepID=UPI003F1CD4D5
MVRGNPPSSRAEREAIDWLVRLQAGDGSERAEFEAWRAADPDNAAAFEAVQTSISSTEAAGDSDMVRNSRLHRASFYERKPGTSCALAAGVALLIFMGAGFGLREAGYFGPPEIASQTLAFSTRIGEVRTVTLDDGSKVTLDADSVLRATYSPDMRQLQLDAGRARFEVAHDPRRPFIVDAGGGSVIAHGTVFDVSIGPSGVQVVLLRGAIEVTKRDRPDQRSADNGSRRLNPGQQVTFDKANPIPQPEPAPPSELRWTSGMLAFEGARLADAVAEFNRYSRRKIVLASPELGELRISGGFHAGEIDKFAQVMAATFGLRVTSEPTRITLAKGEESGAR